MAHSPRKGSCSTRRIWDLAGRLGLPLPAEVMQERRACSSWLESVLDPARRSGVPRQLYSSDDPRSFAFWDAEMQRCEWHVHVCDQVRAERESYTAAPPRGARAGSGRSFTSMVNLFLSS